MNITDIFPYLRVYMNRLAPPMTHWRKAATKSPSHTKTGPGRKHKQGKIKHVNPFAELAGLAGT